MLNYKRKKRLQQVPLPESPPSSDVEQQLVPHTVSSSQKRTGRKLVNRYKSKVFQRNKRLTTENVQLRRGKEKYKKRYYRLLKMNKSRSNLTPNQDLTPNSKVNKIMEENNRANVVRQLLFKEDLESQIKTNLQNQKCPKKKRNLLACLVGDGKVLKK